METGTEEETVPTSTSLEIDSFSKEGFQNLVLLTRISHQLPHETNDYDYYSSFPGFKLFTEKMRERTFSLMQKLSGGICPILPRLARGTSSEGNSLPELEELFDKLVETNDTGLEQVGHLIDILNGVVPPPPPPPVPAEPCPSPERIRLDALTAPPPAPTAAAVPVVPYSSSPQLPTWNRLEFSSGPMNHWARGQMSRSNQIPKPHITREGLDNSDTPFVPSLRGGVKPNAIVKPDANDHTSLDDLLTRMRDQDTAQLHPYFEELQNVPYPQSIFGNREPENPGPLDNHTYEFITTEERVDALVETLNEATEIAIDLEHHDYRSYLGFTCLVQISINGYDFIIDPLCVGHCLHKLLDPFTNPNIIKVLHGADQDVQWLQRDFGLYLVGMFDTHQASIILGLPKRSLAFLLKYCCGVTASKKYQMADWRQRPLSPQMERYAREDTHYLLYIYHRMRNELIRRSTKDAQMFQEVLDMSRAVCLKVYIKPIFNPFGYLKGFSKNCHFSSPLRREIAKELYAWRDRTAREKDESCEYVLPGAMLFQISDRIPDGKHGILACCNPIPPLLMSNINEVVLALEQANTNCKLNNYTSPYPPRKRQSERLNSSSSQPSDPTRPNVLEVSVEQSTDMNHLTPAKDYIHIPEGTLSLPIFLKTPTREETDRKALLAKVLATFTDPFNAFLMRPVESSETVVKHDIHEPISLPAEDSILEQDIIYLTRDKQKPKASNPLKFTTVKPQEADNSMPTASVVMGDNDVEIVLEDSNSKPSFSDFIIINDMNKAEIKKSQPGENGLPKRLRSGKRKKTDPSIPGQDRPFRSFDYSGLPPPMYPMSPPKRMRFQAPRNHIPRHPMPRYPPFLGPFPPAMYHPPPPPVRVMRPVHRGVGFFNRYPPPQHFMRYGVPWPS